MRIKFVISVETENIREKPKLYCIWLDEENQPMKTYDVVRKDNQNYQILLNRMIIIDDKDREINKILTNLVDTHEPYVNFDFGELKNQNRIVTKNSIPNVYIFQDEGINGLVYVPVLK